MICIIIEVANQKDSFQLLPVWPYFKMLGSIVAQPAPAPTNPKDSKMAPVNFQRVHGTFEFDINGTIECAH